MGSPLEKKATWLMFDEISETYDLTNRVMTGGKDKEWRRLICDYLPKNHSLRLLDLATGTLDVPLTMLEAHGPDIQSIHAIDMSEAMLKIGEKKLHGVRYANKVRVQSGDAQAIPFPARSFDAVTISFGIRNVEKVEQACSEMHRVLKPGGRALILEGTVPNSFFLKGPYLLYTRWIMPLLGRMLSGHKHAYRYLNRSIEAFPQDKAFRDILIEAGLTPIETIKLSFGAVTLYIADRA